MDSTHRTAKSPSKRCPRFLSLLIMVAAFGALGVVFAYAVNYEWKSGVVWPEPPVVDPGPVGGPPSDAIVLFGGKDLSQWNGGHRWLVEDGVATARGRSITTKASFGDCQLHVEWASPAKVEGKGQTRGNSGVYIMGKYEVQILDSCKNETYFDGQAGAIYKQSPPMVNACRRPGQWQTFDIIFRAPRFAKDGAVVRPAAMTVLHNGVLIQNHFELTGGTCWDQPPEYEPHAERLPLRLQYHGDPVRFRNIWLRELAPLVGKPSGKTGYARETVAGMVSLDGRPLAKARVALYDDRMKEVASAKTSDDGKFAMKRLLADTYTVTVQAASSTHLPKKYGETDKSGLKLSVDEGNNDVRIELASE
ncbi:MAG: DUF1080 domain-containing protein [Pirellulales bacterium]|nr:DUF1080 domain-containing protein [Pirellulales bacterium]